MNKTYWLISIIFTIWVVPLFSQTKILPPEFKNSKWYEVEERNALQGDLLNLENTIWIYPTFSRIVFSKENYAFGDPWGGITSFGKYTITNYTVIFTPELEIIRWKKVYKIKELLFTSSDRLSRIGSQLLVDKDETVQFLGWDYPEKAKINVINSVECESTHIPIRILKNNYLFALPSDKSFNLLPKDDYYGEKAVESYSAIVMNPVDIKYEWVYIIMDFTLGEPIDGGGPFYYGWIKKQYTQNIIGNTILTISNNLRLRTKPSTDDSSKIIKELVKFTNGKIVDMDSTLSVVNDIKDHWYEIELEDGKRGWVFGGYIKEYSSENDKKAIMAKYK